VVAHYNIRSAPYLEKLVELKNRNVVVKVAVDLKNSQEPHNQGDDYLEEHGIPVVRTKPPGDTSIMHLKTAVIDGEIMMTGSFNWNDTASLANDENMLVLREPELAARYRDQVLEVLGEQPRNVDGGPVNDMLEVHHSPEEQLDTILVREIDAAEHTIDVAMFTLTSATVVDALVRAATQRDVTVRAVVENKQTGLSDADEKLEAAGVQVVRGANRIGSYSAMHQKYAVIDQDTVLTGASNWTYLGTRRNEEDVLILRSADIAARYRENFGDLLHVYAKLDVDDAPRPERPGVLFKAVYSGTEPGDYVVLTGNRPELGNWDPKRGLAMTTSDSMFPNWTANMRFEPGARFEYKFVHMKRGGHIDWEPGQNRRLEVPRRSVVVSGNFGSTQ